MPGRKRRWEEGCGVGSGAGYVGVPRTAQELADHDAIMVGSGNSWELYGGGEDTGPSNLSRSAWNARQRNAGDIFERVIDKRAYFRGDVPTTGVERV